MADMVNHPKHYNSHPCGVEAIEIVRCLPFSLGNAIKYLWRAGHKDNLEQDFQKAIWYLKDAAHHHWMPAIVGRPDEFQLQPLITAAKWFQSKQAKGLQVADHALRNLVIQLGNIAHHKQFEVTMAGLDETQFTRGVLEGYLQHLAGER